MAVALTFGGVFGTTQAQASHHSSVWTAKVLKTHSFKHTYTKYSVGGNIYKTRSLKTIERYGKNYPSTAWTTNYSVKVKKTNGHTATYYYIKSKSGIKGWIWRGDLKDKPSQKAIDAKKISSSATSTVSSNSLKNGAGSQDKGNAEKTPMTLTTGYTSDKSNTSKPAVSTKISDAKSLNIKVSNTNVYGFANVEKTREALRTWKNMLKNNPKVFFDLENSKETFESTCSIYDGVVTGEIRNDVKSSSPLYMSQYDFDQVYGDAVFFTTTAYNYGKY